MWLYKLTNKRTGKMYVGTSVNPITQRISRHVYAAKCNRRDSAIACAIRKYGISLFKIEEIGATDDYEELLRMEAEAIRTLDTVVPKGYNITDGGRGARRPCSLYTRALISAKTQGRIPWNKGQKSGPLSAETKEKLSLAHKGRVPSNKGKKHKPETLLKFKERVPWNRGKKVGPMPEAHRKRIASAVKAARAVKFWSSGKRSLKETEI